MMKIFVLDAVTKSITAIMSGAPAATNPDFVSTWADVTATTFTEGSTDGTFNGANAVDLVPVPAAATRRIIKSITIQNRDSAAVTITINYVSAGGTRQIWKGVLQVNDTWTMGGCIDANGNVKYVIGVVNLTSQVTGILPIANGGTGQSAKAAAFDALQPMTAAGDIIYGGASGTGTKLVKGAAAQLLRMNAGDTAPEWWTLAVADLTTQGIIEIATAAETTTGTDATRAVSPDGLAGSNYGKRVVEIALNGSVNLALTDKAYFRIPSSMNGWNLVECQAMCKTCTTHAHVTLKNGATSMLSNAEAISIEDGEFDTSTSATPPVIDGAHDDVATGAQIELACSVAGANVTYFVVELTFQAP